MSIQALPQETTRRLGSAQVVTSPASLVKELVDNAIDARASAIEVILSANTLDRIEVRDHGHGIAQEDLDSLGKSGHTSKLTKFEDLYAVGRASLGFRGEALASACTMADVTVTTKTEGDLAGTCVKLKPSVGGVESRSSKSHRVGTTVYVSNLFSRIPVRKQFYLKNTAKTISEVKEVLRLYALARLHVRLSLKILGSAKGNWSYIPRQQDGLKEAVANVVGKDVAALCMEHTSYFKETGGSSIAIKAFIARPEADLSKIQGGCFASVDGRPVSKGIVKKIYFAYKATLKELARKRGQDICSAPFLCLMITCERDSYDPNVEPTKDDVLFANSESLIAFTESLFRSLYPPPSAMLSTEPMGQSILKETPAGQEEDYDALIENQLVEEAANHQNTRAIPSSTTESLLPAEDDYDAMMEQQEIIHRAKRLLGHPASHDVPRLDHSSHGDQAHGHPSRARSQTPFIVPPSSPRIANDLGPTLTPWTISNRSTAFPPTQKLPPFHLSSDTTPRHQRQPRPFTHTQETPPASHGKAISHILSNAPFNPSPFSSLPSKPPPGQKTIESWLHSNDDDEAPFGERNHPRARRIIDEDGPEVLEVETPPRKQQRLGPAFVKAGSLSMGVNCTPPHSSTEHPESSFSANIASSRPSRLVSNTHPSSSFTDLPLMSMDDDVVVGHPRHPLHPSQTARRAEGQDFQLFPDQEKGGRSDSRSRGGNFKPFQSHRRTKSSSKSNTASQRVPSPELPIMSLDDDVPVHGHPVPLPAGHLRDAETSHGTPEMAMNFEDRKVAATRRVREENALRALDPNKTVATASQRIDFEKAMLAKMAEISEDGPSVEAAQPTERPSTALPDGDPRAYFIRRQRSMSRNGMMKVKRMKTGLLPLETVPQKDETHGVAVTLQIRDVNVLAQQLLEAGRWDEYITTGKYQEGLGMDDKETEVLEEKLGALMSMWNGNRPTPVLL